MHEDRVVSGQAVRIDLSEGRVTGAAGALALVPIAALEALVAEGPGGVSTLGLAMGGALGEVVRSRAEGELSEFVQALAEAFALSGYGVLSFERWGRALVASVDNSPLPETLLVAVVEGALRTATGRPLVCSVLERVPRAVRILVSSEHARGQVQKRIAGGEAWGEVLVDLQRASGGVS